MTKPRLRVADEASEMVVLAGCDTPNPTPAPLTLQARRLADRFGLAPATARATAALAFHTEAAR